MGRTSSGPNPDAGRGPRSLLSRPLKTLLLVSCAIAAFLVANTLYLLLNRFADLAGVEFFAVGKTSLPAVFQVMILTHTGVGLLAATLFLVFFAWHLPLIWKRRRFKTIATGVLLVAGVITLAVTGLFIMSEAASKNHSWIWWLHVAVAAIAPVAFILHRLFSFSKPRPRSFSRFSTATAGILVAVVAVHMATPRGVKYTEEAAIALERGSQTGPGAKERNVADFLDSAFVPAAFVPPQSPFFPAATTTSTGENLAARIVTRGETPNPETYAADLETIGFAVQDEIGAEMCARCHADIVEQWSKSAHRFASFNNPFYEATIVSMRENANESNEWVDRHIETFSDAEGKVANVRSKWCSGCHDPALMLPGKMTHAIDRADPAAQAGLTCLACHNIDHIHNQTGNGNYNVADFQEDPYLFPDAESGLALWLHDTAIKAKPTVHKRQMLKTFFRESEYCASCHKVNLNVPVNNYRWLRGQNEYDAWHDSGVAHNAARTFYLPPDKRVCQDCHMPMEPAVLGDVSAKNGMVKSHRFLAVNTALPYIRGDTETIERIEAFLQDNKLRVDIFAIRSEEWDEPVLALDPSRPAVRPGQEITVDVVVRNLNVGHTFPGGTNDSNEGWLEFAAFDANDNPLFLSGGIGEDGHLDPDAHVYKALMIDKHSNPIHQRNAQDIHTPVYVKVIGPGTADIGHYVFRIPASYEGASIRLRARLLWRKFDRAYTEFAYRFNPQGFRRFSDVPDLPVTMIAADEYELQVSPKADIVRQTAAVPEDWMRFNDYGIGLFLEGDTRRAADAFEWVRKLQPERVDGHRNLARTAIRNGNLTEAYVHLRKCEDLLPGNAQTAWFWGVALQEDGRYEEAAAAYRRTLEAFPEDRAAWQNLGRTLYLDGQYEASLAAYDEVLVIDPEDRIAWYHKMLCYRALGDEANAARAAEAYNIYQIDETAQQMTQKFRLENPAANRQSQPIRTHFLRPLDPTLKTASAPEAGP